MKFFDMTKFLAKIFFGRNLFLDKISTQSSTCQRSGSEVVVPDLVLYVVFHVVLDGVQGMVLDDVFIIDSCLDQTWSPDLRRGFDGIFDITDGLVLEVVIMSLIRSSIWSWRSPSTWFLTWSSKIVDYIVQEEKIIKRLYLKNRKSKMYKT